MIANTETYELSTKTHKARAPLEYVLGRAQFMGRTFHCSPATLIPRAETGGLVEATVTVIKQEQQTKQELTLVEIGIGCGNIAVSLALVTEHVKILASDVSSAAVEVARRNVAEFGLQERITLFSGDLFEPFEEEGLAHNVDIVVCNPPYIPTGSLGKLPPEIIDFEPRLALDGGPYGIDFFLRLISEAPKILKPGGTLLFEIGERQESLVQYLFEKGAFHEIEPILYSTTVRGFRAITSSS
jgi:release factor glutamine methyltransferase